MKKSSRKLFLKLFSLFFSIFIWLYVVSSEEIEAVKLVPFQIETPNKYALKTIAPKNITFRLKGPRVLVKKFMSKKSRVMIKPKHFYLKGKYNYNIDLSQLYPKVPLGVKLISKSISNFEFTIERSISKVVPIVLSANDLTDTEEKKLLDSMSVKETKISGARSVIRKIKQVYTTPFDIRELQGDSSIELDLNLDDSRVKYRDRSVQINLDFLASKKEFTYKTLPIKLRGNKENEELNAETVELIIEYKGRFAQEDLAEDIKIFVDVEQIEKSERGNDLEVQTILPQGAVLKSIRPSRVELKLKNQ